MDLKSLKKLLEAEILVGDIESLSNVEKVFACDLMSDVLSIVDEDIALMTGLSNIQAIRTAEIKDIGCVIFVRGKIPDTMTLELAKRLGIIVLATKLPMFAACGILYMNGIKGVTI